MPKRFPFPRLSATARCLLSALLLPLALAGCTTYVNAPESDLPTAAQQPHDLDYRVLEDQTYTPPDWPQALQADVYLPETRDEARRPAVMMVHGGGWEGRTRDDMTPIAKRFVKRGYVVVNVSHRFAPEYRFPAQLHDLQVARHWIDDHAKQWRIDPQRIAGFGYSSGAHLVSLLALVAGTDSDLDAPYGGRDTGFAAVISGGTPADLRLWDSGRLLIQLMNGTQAERPTAYAEASPIFHVHPDAPPFFLFHGSWDDLVPPEQPEKFMQALEDDGNHVELLWMNGRGHITTFLFRGSAESAALEFLVREMPDLKMSP
ncbi:alpha/beta hydrolase fold domain-containing protein [Salinicola halophyticus]|uniref:alpha/beta hydrolase fold domain-containing protein n=1 Tax=Salinicola halophyticus TaxID=1808881 RepID=UPI003F445485